MVANNPMLHAIGVVRTVLDAMTRRADHHLPYRERRPLAQSGAVAGGRRVMRERGPVDPIGLGNSKTDLPTMYRPVGDASKGEGTCPATCSMLLARSCYAMFGRTAIHADKAGLARAASLRAAAIAMSVAVLHGKRARLLGSGDGVDPETGEIDLAFWEGLIDIADALGVLLGLPTGTEVAFTYTHIPDFPSELRSRLRQSGIYVRLSDRAQRGGAVIYPHAHVADLRSMGLNPVKCPAQLTNNARKCSDCNLCGVLGEDLTIVFDGEGPRRKAALEASPLHGAEEV